MQKLDPNIVAGLRHEISHMTDEQKAHLKDSAKEIIEVLGKTTVATGEPYIHAVLGSETSQHNLHRIFEVKSGEEPVVNFVSVLYYGEAEPVDVEKAEFAAGGILTLRLVDGRIARIGQTQRFTGILVNNNSKIKEIRARGYGRPIERDYRQELMRGLMNGMIS